MVNRRAGPEHSVAISASWRMGLGISMAKAYNKYDLYHTKNALKNSKDAQIAMGSLLNIWSMLTRLCAEVENK